MIVLTYLSIPIDNVTWQARVSIFNSLKSLLKTETKKVGMLHFLPHHSVSSLYLFLTFILTTQVNNLYYDFSCTIKTIPASFRLRFLKIIDLTRLLLFFIQNLQSRCGDTEGNPGPKYSSLTFVHWNLNTLTAHDSTKISLLQAYITQHNCDIIRLVTEIPSQNEKCFLTCIYRSPSQNRDEFIKENIKYSLII